MAASRILDVGKEANDLDPVEAGLVDELEEMLTVYERSIVEDLSRMLYGRRV